MTFNLRRGRFLLLIDGDVIGEGVEAIAEYLQAHAGLHFTLGLVELPIYGTSDGSRIIVPRVLAKTLTIARNVVSVLEGMIVEEPDDGDDEAVGVPDSSERLAARAQRRETRHQFWSEFLDGLRLDDPEQVLPSPALAALTSLGLGEDRQETIEEIGDRRCPGLKSVDLGFRPPTIVRTNPQAGVFVCGPATVQLYRIHVFNVGSNSIQPESAPRGSRLGTICRCFSAQSSDV